MNLFKNSHKDVDFYWKLTGIMLFAMCCFLLMGIGNMLITHELQTGMIGLGLTMVYGTFTILTGIKYHSRLTRETIALMLGKDFKDYCNCDDCKMGRKI